MIAALLLLTHLTIQTPPPEVARALPDVHKYLESFEYMLREWSPKFEDGHGFNDVDETCLEVQIALASVRGARTLGRFGGALPQDLDAAERYYNALDEALCRNKPPGNRANRALTHLRQKHFVTLIGRLSVDARGDFVVSDRGAAGVGGAVTMPLPSRMAENAKPVAAIILGIALAPETGGASLEATGANLLRLILVAP